MKSNVTECPFKDTEHLAKCADDGMMPITEELYDILEKFKATDLDATNRLETLIYGVVNASQNMTIRNTICINCDKDMECHPQA